jgi:hypothetical protein
VDRHPGEPVTGGLREIQDVIPGEPTRARHGPAPGLPTFLPIASVGPPVAPHERRRGDGSTARLSQGFPASLNGRRIPVRPIPPEPIMSHISCRAQGMVTPPVAAGNDGSAFAPWLPDWSLRTRLRSEGRALAVLLAASLRRARGSPARRRGRSGSGLSQSRQKNHHCPHLEPPVSSSLTQG